MNNTSSLEDQVFVDNRKALKDYRIIIESKKKTNAYAIDSAALHSHNNRRLAHYRLRESEKEKSLFSTFAFSHREKRKKDTLSDFTTLCRK